MSRALLSRASVTQYCATSVPICVYCADSNLRAGVFVPPLPERDDFVWDKFNQAFVETRRRALEIFLHRIVAHPLLVRTYILPHSHS